MYWSRARTYLSGEQGQGLNPGMSMACKACLPTKLSHCSNIEIIFDCKTKHCCENKYGIRAKVRQYNC